MQSLGSLLIADGVCSVQQIEDAIQNQVILGGRMGTNLVELGVIDEETLAHYLSRQH
ncbi:MAG: general secretion pathway protein GspE, partial [Deltaproteobacteria bacterium]|nr:general secretion pathway protein GspE [Deltaproteobacteria bacterium]